MEPTSSEDVGATKREEEIKTTTTTIEKGTTKKSSTSSISDRERYFETFTIFDRDCDGKISKEEMGMAMRACGNPISTENLERLNGLVESFHEDGLNFEEFCHYMDSWKEHIKTKEDIMNAFSSFDNNGSGYINKVKFKKWMMTLGKEPMTEIEADRIISLAGVGTFEFNYHDYVDFMISHIEKPPRKRTHSHGSQKNLLLS